ALLDAALHALEYLDPGREATSEQVRLPFAWAGLRLHAVGATIARVRIVAIGPDAYELTLTDPDGQLVCTVESLTLRPIARDRLLAANTGTHDMLFGVDWTPIREPARTNVWQDWVEWPTAYESATTSESGTVPESGTASAAVLRCEERSGVTDGTPL